MSLKPKFDWYAFNKHVVAGIPVFAQEIPTSQVVRLIAQFEVGVHDDPLEKEGVTHFLEHHTSKRSPLLPTSKDRTEFSEQYTNSTLNACTGTNFVRFECSCIPENVSFVAKRLFDLFCNPLFEGHEKERGAILGEIREKHWENGLVETRAKERRINLFGPNHPASRIAYALGWSDTVERLTLDDVRAWHQKWFTRPHLSLFLCGAIGETTISDLEQGIVLVPKGIPQAHDYPQLIFPHVPATKERTTSASSIGRTNRDHSNITFTGIFPPKRTLDACIPIIHNIIQKLLFAKLRENEGACYGVNVDCFPRPFGNEVSVKVTVPQKKLVQFEQVILTTFKEIGEGQYQDKIAKSIRVVRDSTRLMETTSDRVISVAAASFALYKRIISLEEMIEEISAITPENIAGAIQDYFTKPNLYIDRLVP